MSKHNEHSALLSMVHAGQSVVVVDIHGGYKFKMRMIEMGVVPGEKIIVLNSGHPGPVVIKAKGTKIAIGHGMAQKITVK